MTNKVQAAYILGQNSAMQKHASGALMMAAPAGVMQAYGQDRGGLTYNPRYSQSNIDAIRRYNRDVASGDSTLMGAGVALGLPLHYQVQKRLLNQNIGRMLAGQQPRTFMQSANKGQLLRGAAKDVGRYAMKNKGKAALGLAALYGVGKGLRYMGSRFGQGVDNYIHTDLNAQDRR